MFHHKEEVEWMEQSVFRAEVSNRVLLRGELVERPVYSHENHGKQFDQFTLSVQRLSGTRWKLDKHLVAEVRKRGNVTDTYWLR